MQAFGYAGERKLHVFIGRVEAANAYAAKQECLPMRRFILRAAVLFAALYLFAPEARSQMIGMSTQELARASSLVVVGDVEEVKSHWSDDGRRIVSRATVLVREVVRGKTVDKRITVEYPGGEIGDLGMRVSDVAPVTKGEKVLLFLSDREERRSGPVRGLTGKGQGKYTIGADGIARKKGFSLAERGDAVDHALPLDDLIKKVKSADEDKNNQ